MSAKPTHLNCLQSYCKQFISNRFTDRGSINLSSKLSQAENVNLVLLITGGTARLSGADIMPGQHLHQKLRELCIPNTIPVSPSRDRQAPPSCTWFLSFVPNVKQEGVKTSYLYFKCCHNFSDCTQLKRASCWVSRLGEFMTMQEKCSQHLLKMGCSNVGFLDQSQINQ